MTYWTKPLVVEAAISPLRLFDEPQVFQGEALIEQANSCFAAGAGIVHHLHELALARYVIEKGGHIRTGVEDASGLTSATSAECVAAVIDISRKVGRPTVTGADVLPTLIGQTA